MSTRSSRPPPSLQGGSTSDPEHSLAPRSALEQPRLAIAGERPLPASADGVLRHTRPGWLAAPAVVVAIDARLAVYSAALALAGRVLGRLPALGRSA